MPRYIDADALTENINNLSVMLCGKELFGELAKHSVTQMIDEHPTADVVPSEVFETLKDNNEHLAVMLSEAKQDVAREIFAEINAIKKEYSRGDIDGNELYLRLYMLEKKYTEEKA